MSFFSPILEIEILSVHVGTLLAVLILGGLFPLVIWDLCMHHYGLQAGVLTYDEREWFFVGFLLGCEFIMAGLIFFILSCIMPWTLMQFLRMDAWCVMEYITGTRNHPCPWFIFEEYWDAIDFMMIVCFVIGTFMILPQLWWGITWRETFIAKTALKVKEEIIEPKANIESMYFLDSMGTSDEEEQERHDTGKDHED